jgi:hypothetical protein
MAQSIKSVFAPHLGRDVKFGRRRSFRGPRLSLKNYITGTLPPPPATSDYTPKALSALKNVYLNDSLGDCVIAAGYHYEATVTGNAGNLFTATQAQIVNDYGAIGGYVAGDPSTDQGCDVQTALNYWLNRGFANGTKLVGHISVDPTNVSELQQAMFLFENLYFGVELPDSWINPFPSADGFVWDKDVPNPSNGHAFLGVGHDSNGIKIDSWGLFGTMTYKAIASLCSSSSGGDLDVLISTDMIAKGQTKAPNGVAWRDLILDFNALGGNVPVPPAPPAPAPAPSPTPAPSTNVTLAQAQAWAAAGLQQSWPRGK